MKCPSCSTDNAYIGASVVECVSDRCRHFSKRQHDEVVGSSDLDKTFQRLAKDLEAMVWVDSFQSSSLQVEDLDLDAFRYRPYLQPGRSSEIVKNDKSEMKLSTVQFLLGTPPKTWSKVYYGYNL